MQSASLLKSTTENALHFKGMKVVIKIDLVKPLQWYKAVQSWETGKAAVHTSERNSETSLQHHPEIHLQIQRQML